MNKIYTATEEDIACLVKLHTDSFALGYERPWSEDSFKSALSMTGMKTLIFKNKNKCTAFLMYRNVLDEAEIILLGVDPDHQRQGYAHNLLQHAIHDLKLANVTKIFLDVREDNHAAIAFYKSCEFKESGLRKGYYHLLNEQIKDAKSLYLFIK